MINLCPKTSKNLTKNSAISPGRVNSEFGRQMFFEHFFKNSIKKLSAKFSSKLTFKVSWKNIEKSRRSSVSSERVIRKFANRDTLTATFVHFKSFFDIKHTFFYNNQQWYKTKGVGFIQKCSYLAKLWPKMVRVPISGHNHFSNFRASWGDILWELRRLLSIDW